MKNDKGRIFALPVRPIIEFIGNSITSGATTTKGLTSAFPWPTAEALSCDHTQISIGRRLFAKRLGLQDRFIMETPALPAGVYSITIVDQQAYLAVQ